MLVKHITIFIFYILLAKIGGFLLQQGFERTIWYGVLPPFWWDWIADVSALLMAAPLLYHWMSKVERVRIKGLFEQYETAHKSDWEQQMQVEAQYSSDEKYRNLTATAELGVWRYDLENQWLTPQAGYFEMLGRNADEPTTGGRLNEIWGVLVHPLDLTTTLEGFSWYIRRPEGIYENVFRMKHADGHWVWILSRGKIELDDEGKPGKYFYGINLDISAQKAAEAQHYFKQKMAALGRLASGMAHAHNNIYTMVSGYAELMEKQLSHGQPQLFNYALEIGNAVRRGELFNKKQCFFYRKVQTGAEIVDIHQLLLEFKAHLKVRVKTNSRISLSENIEIEYHLSTGISPVLLDRGSFSEAVVNLAVNAMQAMPEGGKLTFDCSNTTVDTDENKRLHIKEGDYVLLKITDTGTGMGETTQTLMFDPYFTTKGEMGEGLGLSQVYGFMKSSLGGIKVDSSPGHGCCMALYFPLIQRGS